MKKRLVEGPLFFSLLSFSLPLVLGMIGHALFNLVDVFLVGRLSPEAVAAVHIASVVNFIPMILFNGIGVATVAFISRAAGANNDEEVKKITYRSMELTVILGVVLGLLGYIFAEPMVRVLKTTSSVSPLAVSCLELISLGTITMFLLLQVSAIFRAIGDSFWPMVLLIGGNGLNFVLNLVLIFGWGPFPRLEVLGSAWATIIARGLFGILGVVVLMHRGLLKWNRSSLNRETWDISKKLLKLGLPNGVQILARVIAVLVLTSLVQDFDQHHGTNEAAAAFSVGVRLDMLALFGAAGWGAAASSMVGLNLGAKNPERATRAVWTLAGLAALMMFIVGVLFYIFAEPLFHFLVQNPSNGFLEHGQEYLRIIVFSYVFVGVGLVLSGALNGAGSTKLPLLLDSVVFIGLLYPASSAIAGRFGLPGLWWMMVLLNVVLAAIYVLCFNQGKWKHHQLEAIS